MILVGSQSDIYLTQMLDSEAFKVVGGFGLAPTQIFVPQIAWIILVRFLPLVIDHNPGYKS